VDPVGRLHIGGRLLVERPDLVVARLSASVEVLASILGDPNGEVESRVPEFEIGLELREGSVIPVKSHEIESAPSVASLQHVLDPDQTIRGRGGRGTSELVTLAPEGLKVRGPEVSAMLGGHVRLAGLIGFVGAQSVAGVTFDNLLLEIVDLIITPKLGDRSEAKVGGQRGNVGSPSVDESLASVRLEQVKTGVSAHSPGNTELAASSGTVTARTSGGRAGRRSRAGRSRLVGRRRGRSLAAPGGSSRLRPRRRDGGRRWCGCRRRSVSGLAFLRGGSLSFGDTVVGYVTIGMLASNRNSINRGGAESSRKNCKRAEGE